MSGLIDPTIPGVLELSMEFMLTAEKHTQTNLHLLNASALIMQFCIETSVPPERWLSTLNQIHAEMSKMIAAKKQQKETEDAEVRSPDTTH